MTRQQAQQLFDAVWQEDTEITFVEVAKEAMDPQYVVLALSGPPGNPSELLVLDYLQRLYAENSQLLAMMASDRFLGLFS